MKRKNFTIVIDFTANSLSKVTERLKLMKYIENNALKKHYREQLLGTLLAIFLLILPSAAAAQLKIVFQSFRDANREIYVMNPDGTSQTRLTNNPAIDQDPSVSPDGTRIVFDSDRTGNFQIFTMNSDGTNQVRLSNNTDLELAPAFSPDGSRIAYVSLGGDGEVFIMNADGTNRIDLTNNPAFDGDPSFSPDGSKIVFRSARDGNTEIYVMNTDGTNPVRLTNDAGEDYEPVFSPDSTKIAFASDRSGTFQIYVMNADGTNPVRLTNNSAVERHPAFSPDGSKIAFVSNRNGNNDIFVMDPNGANQTALTSDPQSDFFPAWGVLTAGPPPNPSRAQTTDASTACTDFAAGTSASLNTLDYRLKTRLTPMIQSVNPNVFRYWIQIMAPAGMNSRTIEQTITTNNFPGGLFDLSGGSNVFDANCNAVSSNFTADGGSTATSSSITGTWNALSAGTYYISVKYTAKNLHGAAAPSSPTVHYDLTTQGESATVTGIDLTAP